MAGTKVHINPSVLEWARKQAGLSLEEAARKGHVAGNKNMVPAERLGLWESGREAPTRNQLENLAKAYYRPVLTFYMKAPPAQSERFPDFRTVADRPASNKSPVLGAFVRRMRARQQEVVDLIIEDGGKTEPLPFIGRFEPGAGIDDVTADIRRELDVSFEDQRRSKDAGALFRTLRAAAERIRIFVVVQGNLGSYHTDIEAEDFRGIALADPVAPFVVINSNDARAAHIFTLIHELAHLWIGASGISNLSPFSGEGQGAEIERFCNRVASEFLMPKAEIEAAWQNVNKPNLAYAVSSMAKEFSISRAAIANRLWKLGMMDDDDWWRLYRMYQEEWRRHRERLREGDGGPTYHINKRSQLGNALIRTVLGAVESGAITYTRASRILGVNSKSFDRLKELAG